MWLAVVNRRGIKAGTLSEVAASVGLATNSLTYYYRKKEDLVVACLMRSIGALDGVIADVDALLAGRAASNPAVEAKAAAIRAVTARAALFEIADRDAEIEALWEAVPNGTPIEIRP